MPGEGREDGIAGGGKGVGEGLRGIDPDGILAGIAEAAEDVGLAAHLVERRLGLAGIDGFGVTAEAEDDVGRGDEDFAEAEEPVGKLRAGTARVDVVILIVTVEDVAPGTGADMGKDAHEVAEGVVQHVVQPPDETDGEGGGTAAVRIGDGTGLGLLLAGDDAEVGEERGAEVLIVHAVVEALGEPGGEGVDDGALAGTVGAEDGDDVARAATEEAAREAETPEKGREGMAAFHGTAEGLAESGDNGEEVVARGDAVEESGDFLAVEAGEFGEDGGALGGEALEEAVNVFILGAEEMEGLLDEAVIEAEIEGEDAHVVPRGEVAAQEADGEIGGAAIEEGIDVEDVELEPPVGMEEAIEMAGVVAIEGSEAHAGVAAEHGKKAVETRAISSAICAISSHLVRPEPASAEIKREVGKTKRELVRTKRARSAN